MDTRGDSFEKVKESQALRYKQIETILDLCGAMTARQMAAEMHRRGFTQTDDRNNAAPRLTEMELALRVVGDGTAWDELTHRTVKVYRLPNRYEIIQDKAGQAVFKL